MSNVGSVKAAAISRLDDLIDETSDTEGLLLGAKALESLAGTSDSGGGDGDHTEIYQQIDANREAVKFSTTAGKDNKDLIDAMSNTLNSQQDSILNNVHSIDRLIDTDEGIRSTVDGNLANIRLQGDRITQLETENDGYAVQLDAVNDIQLKKLPVRESKEFIAPAGKWAAVASIPRAIISRSTGNFIVRALSGTNLDPTAPYSGIPSEDGLVILNASLNDTSGEVVHLSTDNFTGIQAARLRYDTFYRKTYLELRAIDDVEVRYQVASLVNDVLRDPIESLQDESVEGWRLLDDAPIATSVDDGGVTIRAAVDIEPNVNGRVHSGTVAVGQLRAKGHSELSDTTINGFLKVLGTVNVASITAGNVVAENSVTVAGNEVYHPANKPSKVDVGLDRLENLPLSDVTDGSVAGYASTTAIKRLADNTPEAAVVPPSDTHSTSAIELSWKTIAYFKDGENRNRHGQTHLQFQMVDGIAEEVVDFYLTLTGATGNIAHGKVGESPYLSKVRMVESLDGTGVLFQVFTESPTRAVNISIQSDLPGNSHGVGTLRRLLWEIARGNVENLIGDESKIIVTCELNPEVDYQETGSRQIAKLLTADIEVTAGATVGGNLTVGDVDGKNGDYSSLSVGGKEVYHPSNKPTNVDVGLEKIVNLPLVDDIKSTVEGYVSTSAMRSLDERMDSLIEGSGLIGELKEELETHAANADNPHSINKDSIGLSNLVNLPRVDGVDATITGYASETAVKVAYDAGRAAQSATHILEGRYSDHSGNLNNPHNVDKNLVGLSLLNNKPLSDVTDGSVEGYASTEAIRTTMQAAVDGLETAVRAEGQVRTVDESVRQYMGREDNPHNVTKTQIGLGKLVDKPLSNGLNGEVDGYAGTGAVATLSREQERIELSIRPAVEAGISVILGGVDGTADTLKELADLIGDNDSAIGGMTTLIGTKIPKEKISNAIDSSSEEHVASSLAVRAVSEKCDLVSSTAEQNTVAIAECRQVADSATADLDTKLDADVPSVAAAKLTEAREIKLTGAVNGHVNFDGSVAVELSTALQPTDRIEIKGGPDGSIAQIAHNETAETVLVRGDMQQTLMDNVGDMVVWGNVRLRSDVRVKCNIRPIKDALARVLNIEGVLYDRLDTGSVEYGVIAQAVLKEFPELVSSDKGGLLNVAYGNMIAVLIEALRELNDEVLKERQWRRDIEKRLVAIEETLAAR